MAILDFQGEIIAIDLPNPEDTQIWVGENELLHSRQMFWTTQVACWLKQLKTGKLTSPDYFSS